MAAGEKRLGVKAALVFRHRALLALLQLKHLEMKKSM
jgi:hypothetical protein